MLNDTFDRPVYVRDGAITVTIDDIAEALAFMGRWPRQGRGVVYDTVCWGLRAAQQRQISVETARKSFEGWARAHGVLEAFPTRVPWSSSHGFGGGMTT